MFFSSAGVSFCLSVNLLVCLCLPGLIHLSQGHEGRHLRPPQQEGMCLRQRLKDETDSVSSVSGDNKSSKFDSFEASFCRFDLIIDSSDGISF